MGSEGDSVCLAHSGLVTRVTKLEEDVKDLKPALKSVEKTVWQAMGASLVVFTLLEKVVFK